MKENATEERINDLLRRHLRLILSAARVPGGLEAVNSELAEMELEIVRLEAKNKEAHNGE